MEKHVSSWFHNKTLPESYVFPPETRPGKYINPPQIKTIPVIDLTQTHSAIQQIIKASQDFGFFQVINHGIEEKLLNDTMNIFKELFEMSPKEKETLFDSNHSGCLYTSSLSYETEDIHLWRDNLKHSCHPLENHIENWPKKPARYRELVERYSIETRKLGLKILEMICEGLGLETQYFEGKLSEEVSLSVNHYPPCPDPSLTLGIVKHCDHSLLTLLFQGDVSGLQVLNDDEWTTVDPIPNAFVINIGHILKIISNDKLKSVEHRVVTNSTVARTTAGMFIIPCRDGMIQPAEPLTRSNPPLYRSFLYKEFFANFVAKKADCELAIEPFKLHLS